MKLMLRILGLIPLLLAGSNALADPENFMISDFTFVRPPDWEWVTPEAQSRKAHLRVWDADHKSSADAIFYFFSPGDDFGNPTNCVKRWQAQFQEREKIVPKTETVSVGENRVTYSEMEGTFKQQGKPIALFPNYGLFGALIEAKQGNIMIRMIGPKKLVHEAITEFKKMVETALKPE